MIRRRPRTSTLIAIGAAALLVAAGLVYLRLTSDSGPAGPPGQKVSVGEHALYIACQGSGSPTVVLDAGLGANHRTWAGVMSVLGRATPPRTRVCAYDRWGRGDSDDSRGNWQSVGQAGDELRALLRASGIQPPYVLVGHSIAGLIQRRYTMAYPGEVSGLVMVDTVPDDWDRYLHVSAFSGSGETLIYTDDAEVLRKDGLGARPTVVVQAEKTAYLDPSAGFGEYWHRSQRALATLSTNSILVTAKGSDHLVPDDRPDLVARSIELVVDAARAGVRLPACEASGLTEVDGAC
jgi:pimeloyl-ACP methyl ester carboxylesterase